MRGCDLRAGVPAKTDGALCGSDSQVLSTATVGLANGVQRSFRPLPMTRT
jgi:uncharacterized protein with beta-barrel porin domain